MTTDQKITAIEGLSTRIVKLDRIAEDVIRDAQRFGNVAEAEQILVTIRNDQADMRSTIHTVSLI